MTRAFVVAVDVGTGSARAGVFDASGRQLARAEHPIAMNRPAADHAEHDSEDIWAAVCDAVKAARENAGVAPEEVAGLAFDATCSLVVRSAAGEQVSVSLIGERRWDTIVWLDHRASAEADMCTATGHRVIDHAGGAMSPEMATPKLAWLKRNLPESWCEAGLIFDLTDYLAFRATGSTARSQCTLTCKWTYLAHEEDPWARGYFQAIGLDDLRERAGLPDRAVPAGTDLGTLTPEAAAELGLPTECRVGAGLIDAHAGAIGVLAAYAGRPEELDRHLALVAGTSSCVTSLARRPIMQKGLWGPYFGAALPNLWLSEGGQSATGALLDHVIRIHSGGLKPDRETHGAICRRVMALREVHGDDFGARLHVLPDFHGNRSPVGDPHALGVISGLTLDSSFDGLCRLYWRTAVAIALGLRHILEAMNAAGHSIDTLHVTGGHTHNPLLMQLYADATGCALVQPAADDAVLLGTAMVAATAAGLYPDLTASCLAMQQGGEPRSVKGKIRPSFERDYAVFLAMQKHRAEIDAIQRLAFPAEWGSVEER